MFTEFLENNALNIVLIIIFAYVGRRFAMIFVSRVVKKTIRAGKYKTLADERQREDTVVSTLSTALRVMIWVIAGLLLMSEFGVNIGPLLAGAGIAGVALGFGAQSMVKDFLAGIFIVMENQYRVGDVIQINQSVSGVVEHVSLRATVLRDLDGMVHHISNGEIQIATNMTMEFANVNLDIGVGYDTDINKLELLINEIGTSIAQDETWQNQIFEAPVFLRVDDFADSAIIIKITGKTAPMRQWAVTGELRKRLKAAFDKEGIEIPFPQRVIHEAKKPKSKK